MNEHTNPAGIEAALDALLTSALEADRIDEAKLDPARPMSARAFAADSIPTREQAMVSALVRSPIGAACRQAIKVLGQGLYDIGGRDLMDEIAARAQGHSQGGRRLTILDHAWNGVGKDGDRWWA